MVCAQTITKTEEQLAFEKLTNDLELLAMNEASRIKMIDMRVVKFYDEDYNQISLMETAGLRKNPNLVEDTYIDDKGQVIALRMRPGNADELEIQKSIRTKTGQGSAKPVAKIPSQLAGSQALDYSITDIDGTTYTKEVMRGKVVVFNFWFIGCEPCEKEIPELNELVKKYASDDIVFIAIARDSQKDIEEFIKSQPCDFKQVAGDTSLINAYNIMMYPTHLVIDGAGVIRYGGGGYGKSSLAKLEKAIQQQKALRE